MRPLIVTFLLDGILAGFRLLCLAVATDDAQFEHALDLTGQVTKTECHYFAYGGNGEVWKALLTQKYPVRVMEVQACLLARRPFMKH